MSNYKDFVPKSEDERQFVEFYNNLSMYISDRLKEVDEKERFTVLKEATPSDLSLMNLFLLSLKNEDYEICEVANRLLKERGLEFKTDKW